MPVACAARDHVRTGERLSQRQPPLEHREDRLQRLHPPAQHQQHDRQGHRPAVCQGKPEYSLFLIRSVLASDHLVF